MIHFLSLKLEEINVLKQDDDHVCGGMNVLSNSTRWHTSKIGRKNKLQSKIPQGPKYVHTLKERREQLQGFLVQLVEIPNRFMNC